MRSCAVHATHHPHSPWISAVACREARGSCRRRLSGRESRRAASHCMCARHAAMHHLVTTRARGKVMAQRSADARSHESDRASRAQLTAKWPQCERRAPAERAGMPRPSARSREAWRGSGRAAGRPREKGTAARLRGFQPRARALDPPPSLLTAETAKSSAPILSTVEGFLTKNWKNCLCG